MELVGDGRVASDRCIKGGLARLGDKAVVVIGCAKGHSPGEMQASNYGMPAPAGYRTAFRLMQLAERFKLPVSPYKLPHLNLAIHWRRLCL